MTLTRNMTLRALPMLRFCYKHNKELIMVAWYSESKKTAEFVKPQKRKGVIERSRHFVDYVKVTVRGGNGGNGLMSFSSLPNLEWAGPDGGNGGNGGHVIFKVSHNAKSLAHLQPTIEAPEGIKGKTKQRDGKNATHLTIQVPFGTVVRSENGCVLASLDDADAIFIAARGGAGGKGNYFFLSNENRAPAMAEKGGSGQERVLHVELKTMAHAGLIGFPNAGKSSLLRAISRAQPKVSPYPFTTLNPHIGMVLYDDHQQVAVADIPGLIPGSHLNKGMGHSFLRHIERCLCLIYVIDLSLDRPWEQLKQLKYELNQYQQGLADRPAMLVANKIDLPGAQDRLDGLKMWLRNEKLRRKKSNENGRMEAMYNDNEKESSDHLFIGWNRKESGNSEGINKFSAGAMDNRSVCFDDCQSDDLRDNVPERKNKRGVKGFVNKDLTAVGISGDCLENKNKEVVLDQDISDRTDILVLSVSAKKENGIREFVHHLRVIYDSHLSSKTESDNIAR